MKKTLVRFELESNEAQIMEQKLCDRYKLDPDNPNKKIPFENKTEYLRYIVKNLNRAGSKEWYLFVNILDNEFRDKYG